MAFHELLMDMKVVTLYCFVGGKSIQTGAVDDSEVSFFPAIKYGNFVASPSELYLHPTVHMHIGNLNRRHTVAENFEHWINWPIYQKIQEQLYAQIICAYNYS